MLACVFVYMATHVNQYPCIFIQLCIFHVHKCVHVICVYMYVSVFVCLCMFVCVHVFMCFHVCFYLCTVHVTFLCVNLGLKSICILMKPYEAHKFIVCSFSVTVLGIPSCMSEWCLPTAA